MGLGEDLFGRKPTVPPLARTSIDEGQAAAIKANLAAEPGIAQIAGFTRDQILSMMRSVIPGFDKITETAGSNISDMLEGKIPDSVSSAIEDSAAAKSLGAGTAGSGFHRDLVARDLGLTSLALTEKGLSEAESWMGAAERMLAPAVQDLSSMFISPMQEYQTTNEQNVQQFQRQWMSNQIDAMPDPVIRGIQDTVMQLSGRGGTPAPAGAYGRVSGGVGSGGAGGYGSDFGSWESYGQDWSMGSAMGSDGPAMDLMGTGVQGVDIPG